MRTFLALHGGVMRVRISLEMTINPTALDRETPFFDRVILLRHCMEDRPLAHNLLELYLGDLAPRALALRAAVQAGDPNAVQQVAHAIRGASLTVGAQGVAHLTQDIESACRRGDLAWTTSVLAELEELMMATRTAMQRMMSEEPVEPGRPS